MFSVEIKSDYDRRQAENFLKSPAGRKLKEADAEEYRVLKQGLHIYKMKVSQEYRIQQYSILHKITGEVVPLTFNVGQWKLWNAIKVQKDAGLPVRVIVLKCRQWGGSTEVAAYLFDSVTFGEYADNRRAFIMSDDIEKAIDLFAMHEIMYDNPPDGWVFPERKIAASRHWKFKGIGSHIQVATADIGKRAGKKGRGGTRQHVHVSEVAYYGDAVKTMLGVVNSVPNAQHTSLILETTANGTEGYFPDQWKLAVAGKSRFIPVFVGWHECREMGCWREFVSPDEKQELLRSLSKEEVLIRDIYHLEPEQLHWRRLAIVELAGGDERLFKQEHPINADEAFLTTGSKRFNAYILDEWIKKREIEHKYNPPVRRDARMDGEFPKAEAGDFYVYEEPEDYKIGLPPREYLVIVDVSQGIEVSEDGRDRDESVIAVLKRGNMAVDTQSEYKSLSQVAKWSGLIEPVELANLVYHIGLWYNKALVAVEANGSGSSVNYQLQHILNYPYVYTRTITDKTTQKATKQLGFYTSSTTKPQAVDTLAEMIEERDIEIRDLKTLNQCLTFIRKGKRIEAQAGCKDDEVIVLAIGAFVNLEYSQFKQPKDSIKTRDEVKETLARISKDLKWGRGQTELQRMQKKSDNYLPVFG